MKHNVLIITGPTAVGKTELVLNLTNNSEYEIINIDVGQFYEPLSIGTAKPDWKSEPVKHHLFDIIKSPENLSVFSYRKIVLEKVNEITSSGKLPVLVGGSAFYIHSLFFPVEDINSVSKCNDFIEIKKEELWQRLYEIDAVRASKIEKNDEYRLRRALELWLKTGIKPSHHVPKFDPPFNFTLLIIDRDREELYNRINSRVIEMLDVGWVEEVKSLDTEWRDFLKKKKLIGYNEILQYLEAESISKKELVEGVSKKTRNYAKRQLTYLRMLSSKLIAHSYDRIDIKSKIVWSNLTLLNDINTLCASLKK